MLCVGGDKGDGFASLADYGSTWRLKMLIGEGSLALLDGRPIGHFNAQRLRFQLGASSVHDVLNRPHGKIVDVCNKLLHAIRHLLQTRASAEMEGFMDACGGYSVDAVAPTASRAIFK
jgi:hypothetical protein